MRKPGAKTRVSPRELSALTRQLIYEEFRSHGDMDRVAKAHKVPVRTVDSILHWFALRIVPQSERGVGAVARRSA